MKQIKIAHLQEMKNRGEKIAILTSYDASFTRQLEAAGVDVLLVGDSLGNVVQGHESTLAVTMDDMVYHARCVARASDYALRVVDMPYQSYALPEQALLNARRLVNEGRAQMVKLEGGALQLDNVEALVNDGIRVCGHIGLLPQSIKETGGYFVQGKTSESAQSILQDALDLQSAGVDLLVVECVPAALGKRISRALTIPVIGIGAGVDCDGQVLVVYDLLGFGLQEAPRFVRDFLANQSSIAAALRCYVTEVKAQTFPAVSESY